MNKDEFINELKKLGISLTQSELNSFETYKNLLQEYNKKFNLTTIIEDESIYLKHFYDSLCLMKVVELKTAKTILDIGTGAGFPGIPLKILNEDVKMTLVDSLNKRITFLEEVIKKKDTIKRLEYNQEILNRFDKNRYVLELLEKIK